MLNYLTSIYSKVVTIFTTLYSKLVYLAGSGYLPLYQFAVYFFSTVSEYWSFRQHDVRHYSQVARPKTDDIAVWNYNNTKYVANHSFWDILNTRQQWLPALRRTSEKALYLLKGMQDIGQSQVITLINTPAAMVNHVMGEGARQLLNFTNNLEPKLTPLAERYPFFAPLTDAIRAFNLTRFIDTEKVPLQRRVEGNAGVVNKLAYNADRLKDLGDSGTYSRIKQGIEVDLPSLKELGDALERYPVTLTKEDYQKLTYLLTVKWKFLQASLEDPSAYTLRMIRDDFWAWFVYMLYDELTSPVDKKETIGK